MGNHPEFVTVVTQKHSPILIKRYTERQQIKILTEVPYYHFNPESLHFLNG